MKPNLNIYKLTGMIFFIIPVYWIVVTVLNLSHVHPYDMAYAGSMIFCVSYLFIIIRFGFRGCFFIVQVIILYLVIGMFSSSGEIYICLFLILCSLGRMITGIVR